jgi:hypothetical protein
VATVVVEAEDSEEFGVVMAEGEDSEVVEAVVMAEVEVQAEVQAEGEPEEEEEEVFRVWKYVPLRDDNYVILYYSFV